MSIRKIFEQTRLAAEDVRAGKETYQLYDVTGNLRNVKVDEWYEHGSNVELDYDNYSQISRFLTEARTTSKEPVRVEDDDKSIFPITLICTKKEIGINFPKWKRKWDTSLGKETLIKHLDNKENLSQVTKIICFGLGSPERPERGEKQASKRQFIQHLAANTIAEEIIKSGNRDVQVYAQDPVYDVVDKESLDTLDPPIQVLDDPCGILEIDENTIIVSFCVNFPLRQIVADICDESGKRPFGVWWNFHEDTDVEVGDRYSKKVKKFMERYEQIWKLEDSKEEKNWLCPSVLAWRKP